MKTYRKQIKHKVYETGMQGFVDQLKYEGEWLYEDDPKIKVVVEELKKMIEEQFFGWANLEVEERFVEVK